MDGLLRDAVARIAGPGQVVRSGRHDSEHHSGYFNDFDALARSVNRWMQTLCRGIYVTLNEVNPLALPPGKSY